MKEPKPCPSCRAQGAPVVVFEDWGPKRRIVSYCRACGETISVGWKKKKVGDNYLPRK